MSIPEIVGIGGLILVWIAMIILEIIRFRSYRIEDKQRETIRELRKEIARLELLLRLTSNE